MLSREEAEELCDKLLNNEIDLGIETCWHFGRCELKYLLDKIYEDTTDG